ncbi:K+ transporter Trk [Nitrosococcus oceani ATCC 19707]|uniref:Trk system potassium uptake protein n=2 Tax=Nitrosococcus oceani TaxID=1229 RepID=Q3JEH4_NITOC|nr:TrkH family potassium uptake protein [Nitrosococcus oceani]ABA56772.1 K+ transporter Trk [Nitrosococcus oceani ATCC 19707]EDZ66657.1 potassium uptake protein, TrkH family [Nitrosococcus oceani AFC27]KFI20726.1 potassium transporter [Nitrosococcus oceani C-27]GEM20529.1 potassium transporter [Nitrosococcus oceani]
MQLAVVQRILGLLLALFSTAMLPPVIVSLFYRDGAGAEFLIAFGLILGIGLLCWLPVRNYRQELRLRDGFVVVVMFWVVLSLSGALPLFLTAEPRLSFTDAVFESVSGLTTTGATVITGLDNLPKSVLFYRQELQWLGGMGIVVLAVAILPMLGIGGMQLYRAEIPGPMKTTKLTPRIAETAKALWLIYLGLTIACATAYWIAGMTLFDAVGHSFSTIAIGGFSTHDASMGYFNSPLIEMIAVFFMLLAGVNFSLHFLAWRHRTVGHYWQDEEFRTYLSVLAGVAALTSSYLWITHSFDNPLLALQHGIFHTVSIGTTTGFTSSDYYSWPGFLPILLLMTSYIGGCAASTAGGMKVIRILLLYKQGVREIKRLIHPSAIIPIKIGSKSLPDRIVEGVGGFMAVYVACFIVMYLLLLATGLDMITSFSAVTACLNNLGPGLGQVGAHYEVINAASKWVLCFAMLLGRLEIFTLLVILSPTFWRR